MNKTVIANWKMNGNSKTSKEWASEVCDYFSSHDTDAEIVVCPPFPLLPLLKNCFDGCSTRVPIHLGGQDCHMESKGAYTGDTSADLLKDVGCRYVIVGHSERRSYAGESNDLVRQKAVAAIKAGVIPVICIGETQQQREEGETMAVIARQINESVPVDAAIGHFILAYEPVWAIGSGNVPTMDEIKEVHLAIVKKVSEHVRAKNAVDIAEISVLYGGSVKPDNAGEIMALENVAGVLVGGASLKADDFCKIISS